MGCRDTFIALACWALQFTPAFGHSNAPADWSLPARLSETGLFAAGSTTEPGPGVLPFSPQYPLWSDGATKRRWIWLPPGTQIDATDPDAWEFPAGTRLYKEFALDRRIETRVIARQADGSWTYGVYVWREAGRDALLAPEQGIPALPVAAAPDGRYAVPSRYDCRACHEGARVPVLGFSALQLSTDRDPLAPHADAGNPTDLNELVRRGLIRNLPERLLQTPPRIAAATPAERAALGYLHGNCGHCHGAEADAAVPVNLRLQQTASGGAPRESLRSLLEYSRFQPVGTHAPARIVRPGDAAASVLPLRMRSRDPRIQMPPLGTRLPDTAGLALIERWIGQSSTSFHSVQEATP